VYKPVDAIEVRVWGKKVGAVALDPNLRFYAFEYEPSFVKGWQGVSPQANK
jgi:serine/threonine-protein kinase HipA